MTFAVSVFAAYFLMHGVPSLVLPRAMIAFNVWIARLFKRRPLPEREADVRVWGMVETIIGALLLVFSFS